MFLAVIGAARKRWKSAKTACRSKDVPLSQPRDSGIQWFLTGREPVLRACVVCAARLMNRKIMPITVKPTQADLAIAREVVRYINERTEKAAPGARTNICSRPLRLAGGCGAAGVKGVKGRPATICW